MDIHNSGAGRLKLKIDSRKQLEGALDRAVTELISKGGECALDGILVTRHDHNTFTVEFSSAVKRGVVLEQDLRVQGLPAGRSVKQKDLSVIPALPALC